MKTVSSLGCFALAVVVALAACDGKVAGRNDDETHFVACHANSECAAGQVCVEGTCATDNGAIQSVTSDSASSMDSGTWCGIEIVRNPFPDSTSCQEGSDAGPRTVREPTGDGAPRECAANSYGLLLPASADVVRTIGNYEPCQHEGTFDGGTTIETGVGFDATCDEKLFLCRHECTMASDCPSGGTGTARPDCINGRCQLPCEGAVCPDGMHCVSSTSWANGIPLCMWPQPYSTAQ